MERPRTRTRHKRDRIAPSAENLTNKQNGTMILHAPSTPQSLNWNWRNGRKWCENRPHRCVRIPYRIKTFVTFSFAGDCEMWISLNRRNIVDVYEYCIRWKSTMLYHFRLSIYFFFLYYKIEVEKSHWKYVSKWFHAVGCSLCCWNEDIFGLVAFNSILLLLFVSVYDEYKNESMYIIVALSIQQKIHRSYHHNHQCQAHTQTQTHGEIFAKGFAASGLSSGSLRICSEFTLILNCVNVIAYGVMS